MSFILYLSIFFSLNGNDSIPPDTLKEKLEKLFEEASLWRVGENIEKVDKAREELIKMGEVSLKFIFKEKFKTESSLERRALKKIISALKKESIPYLHEALLSENDTIRKNAIWLCGEIKDTSSVEELLKKLTKEKDYKFIARIIRSLGKIADTVATLKIIPFKDHKKERVRIYVAEALGKLKDKRGIPPLLSLLSDSFFTVRGTAVHGLKQIGATVFDTVLALLKVADDPTLIVNLLSVAGPIAESLTNKEQEIAEYKKLLFNFLESEDWVIRGYAVEALSHLRSEGVLLYLKERRETEIHPFVLGKYEEILK